MPTGDHDPVFACADLDAAIRWFVDQLGFRLRSIWPADEPRVAVVERGDTRVRLQRDTGTGTSPWPLPSAPSPLPAHPTEVVVRANAAAWHSGRAGMRYLDLIPGRLGGRYIASRIRLDTGGPVPDYVHFHRITVQLLYCVRGDIEVVYEDQGPPLRMATGDCIVQPPTIRHRVLHADAGAEVVEFACPAEHETIVDHGLALPNGRATDRDHGGQRFLHDRAAAARWTTAPGAERLARREFAVDAATHGFATARVTAFDRDGIAHSAVRATPAEAKAIAFTFVLRGSASTRGDDGRDLRLDAGDAWTVCPARPRDWRDATPDFEALEIESR